MGRKRVEDRRVGTMERVEEQRPFYTGAKAARQHVARSGGAKPEAAVHLNPDSGNAFRTAIFDSHFRRQPYLGSEFKQADALVTSPNLYGELHQCVLRVIIIWKCLKLRAE